MGGNGAINKSHLKVANSTPLDNREGVQVKTRLAKLTKYIVNTRAFHPNKNFEGWGFRFHGDNRGFSLGESWFERRTGALPTSRIWQRYVIDASISLADVNKSVASETESNYSGPGPGAWRITSVVGEEYKSKRYKPRSKVSIVDVQAPHGTQKIIESKSHFAGENHAFLFSTTQQIFLGATIVPTLDVVNEVWMRIERVSKYIDIVSLCYGDGFPNSESFITDPSGKKLFLGTHVRIGYPATHLWNEPNRLIWGTAIRVEIDAEGNFANRLWIFSHVLGGSPTMRHDYPTRARDEKCSRGAAEPRFTSVFAVNSKEKGTMVWNCGKVESILERTETSGGPLYLSAYTPLDSVRGSLRAAFKAGPIAQSTLEKWNSSHLHRDPNGGRYKDDAEYEIADSKWKQEGQK